MSNECNGHINRLRRWRKSGVNWIVSIKKQHQRFNKTKVFRIHVQKQKLLLAGPIQKPQSGCYSKARQENRTQRGVN